MDRDKFLQERQELIAERGYTFVGVFDPAGKDPSFVYSAGLTERAWPEVILVCACLSPRTIEILLTDLVEAWMAEGEFVMGDNPGLLVMADGKSYPLRVVEIPNGAADEYGTLARTLYPLTPPMFVQVLWPDRNGKFPDEDDYDDSMTQPLIGKTKKSDVFTIKRGIKIIDTVVGEHEAIELFLNTIGPNEGKDVTEAQTVIRHFLDKDDSFAWGDVTITRR